MTINLTPRSITRFFLGAVLVLTVLHGFGLWVFFTFDGQFLTLIEYFDFGVEGNIPTFYSSWALLFSAVLLFLIAVTQREAGDVWNRYWMGLCIIFVYLAVDEAVQLHELLSNFMERYLESTGLLYYLWVVPYVAVTFVLALVYWPFLASLPESTRKGFMLAAVVFLGGAVGVEMLSAAESERSGTSSLRYCLLYSIEEFLEMMGVVLFIGNLTRYLENLTGKVVFTLHDKG